MSLAVDVTHRFGSFLLEARFVSDGRLTAFFGRSGSGKTSLTNIIAGVVRPDRGRIVLDDTVLVDTKQRIYVPKYRRVSATCSRRDASSPTSRCGRTCCSGQWFTAKRERHIGLDQVLDLLGIAHLMDRRPGALSGGEKQRVAIGRAPADLAAGPAPGRAARVPRRLAQGGDPAFIERLRDEADVPIVYVSHSISEVTAIGDDRRCDPGRPYRGGRAPDRRPRARGLVGCHDAARPALDRGDGLPGTTAPSA
jgi:molybdate transport system ATP-binding protein